MKWAGKEDSPSSHGDIQANHVLEEAAMDDPLFRHGFYVKNKHGFRDAVVDRKGDEFAETGAAVLCPGFLGSEVPFGCVWRGGREAFARSSASLR